MKYRFKTFARLQLPKGFANLQILSSKRNYIDFKLHMSQYDFLTSSLTTKYGKVLSSTSQSGRLR